MKNNTIWGGEEQEDILKQQGVRVMKKVQDVKIWKKIETYLPLF